MTYLKEQLVQHIDYNQDGLTSAAEWGKLYHQFGMTYDEENPSGLSCEKEEKILNELQNF